MAFLAHACMALTFRMEQFICRQSPRKWGTGWKLGACAPTPSPTPAYWFVGELTIGTLRPILHCSDCCHHHVHMLPLTFIWCSRCCHGHQVAFTVNSRYPNNVYFTLARLNTFVNHTPPQLARRHIVLASGNRAFTCAGERLTRPNTVASSRPAVISHTEVHMQSIASCNKCMWLMNYRLMRRLIMYFYKIV